jgi:norsolorinic acid ketoreductase
MSLMFPDSWVQTGLGQGLADSLGVTEPPMSIEDSAAGCIKLIDAYSKENTGKFYNVATGQEVGW